MKTIVRTVIWDGRSETSATYDFFTDLALEVNDVVVVDTVRGYQLARVTDTAINIVGNVKATKWVIDRVDFTGFNDRQAKQAQADKIRAKLQAKKRKFDEQQIFERMAEVDPEAAELLEQLKALND